MGLVSIKVDGLWSKPLLFFYGSNLLREASDPDQLTMLDWSSTSSKFKWWWLIVFPLVFNPGLFTERALRRAVTLWDFRRQPMVHSCSPFFISIGRRSIQPRACMPALPDPLRLITMPQSLCASPISEQCSLINLRTVISGRNCF